MTLIEAECVLPGGAVLGEGPVWDDQTQRLYWLDIEEGKICRFDPSTKNNESRDLGTRVGFAVLTESGDLLAGTQRGLERFDWDKNESAPYANPEPELSDNRFNDGKCDPQGRLWGGTMCIDESQPPKGTLYRIDSNGEVNPQHSPVSISNGLAWTKDSRTLYYIDSPTRRIDAFDFSADTGVISNQRKAFELTGELGYPDGMTIDGEDMVWVALWEGWGVGRFNPATGELLAKVEVPVACVTSCCFGGPDFSDLYITTASRDLTDETRPQQPDAGGIFRARPNVPGTASVRFKG